MSLLTVSLCQFRKEERKKGPFKTHELAFPGYLKVRTDCTLLQEKENAGKKGGPASVLYLVRWVR